MRAVRKLIPYVAVRYAPIKDNLTGYHQPRHPNYVCEDSYWQTQFVMSVETTYVPTVGKLSRFKLIPGAKMWTDGLINDPTSIEFAVPGVFEQLPAMFSPEISSTLQKVISKMKTTAS